VGLPAEANEYAMAGTQSLRKKTQPGRPVPEADREVNKKPLALKKQNAVIIYDALSDDFQKIDIESVYDKNVCAQSIFNCEPQALE